MNEPSLEKAAEHLAEIAKRSPRNWQKQAYDWKQVWELFQKYPALWGLVGAGGGAALGGLGAATDRDRRKNVLRRMLLGAVAGGGLGLGGVAMHKGMKMLPESWQPKTPGWLAGLFKGEQPAAGAAGAAAPPAAAARPPRRGFTEFTPEELGDPDKGFRAIDRKVQTQGIAPVLKSDKTNLAAAGLGAVGGGSVGDLWRRRPVTGDQVRRFLESGGDEVGENVQRLRDLGVVRELTDRPGALRTGPITSTAPSPITGAARSRGPAAFMGAPTQVNRATTAITRGPSLLARPDTGNPLRAVMSDIRAARPKPTAWGRFRGGVLGAIALPLIAAQAGNLFESNARDTATKAYFKARAKAP